MAAAEPYRRPTPLRAARSNVSSGSRVPSTCTCNSALGIASMKAARSLMLRVSLEPGCVSLAPCCVSLAPFVSLEPGCVSLAPCVSLESAHGGALGGFAPHAAPGQRPVDSGADYDAERPAEVSAVQAGEMIGDRPGVGRDVKSRVDPQQGGHHADHLGDD